MEKNIEFQLLRLELRRLGWTCWPYGRSHLCSIHDSQVSGRSALPSDRIHILICTVIYTETQVWCGFSFHK